ncbi:hypothetical protein CERZMDRAFT_37682 [Cercospora zeae-maydis SCOH1-5]|uniref:DUF1275 domain protein n=1 Tax=Cercospora zeae-maydis SCOH1-5 TaxID=717836 RepID=A0A6A6FLG1_9PEZI|nr:hypothetical protein CERZMDRAFT_37682 [Cercospora zeae-maydis SCOH1-5]
MNGSSRPTSNRLFSGTDEEAVHLLHKHDKSPNVLRRTAAHFNQNVRKDWADLLLLSCYVITGLLDSSSVYTFGSFVSMQTGNTIYLGTGIVAPTQDDRWIRALTSISFFCLGSFVFARYHRSLGAEKRWVIVLSLILQTMCIGIAAVMVTIGPHITPKGELSRWVVVPLALIGFQAAGQAYLSRVLRFNALTSVVLTSIYHDLFADAELFSMPRSNIERNQRAGAVVLCLVGAMIGGIFAHSSIGLAGALWTATGLKCVIIIVWSLWKAESPA